MIRSYSPFYGKRFIGDTGKHTVHDLLHEDSLKCQINKIDYESIRIFDNLKQAKEEGYKTCEFCFKFDLP